MGLAPKCAIEGYFGSVRGKPWFFSGYSPNPSKILCKSLVSYRNSPDISAVIFYERHLWAGLLGWPD